MYRRLLIATVAMVLVVSSLAFAQVDKVAIFYEQVGWISEEAAKEAGDAIASNITVANEVVILNDAEMATFAIENTGDGNLDVIILFGYLPVSLYTPGNVESDGSVGELFLEGGDMILNTADYIFYVTEGGPTNGDTGLKNMTDSNFDCWTDETTCSPTADGIKYVPSLPESYSAPRCLRRDQVEEDPDWEVEIAFGDNGENNMDPAIIRNKNYGGRVGIAFQVSDDTMPRGAVMTEIINNYLSGVTTAVKPAEKVTSTWGSIKSF